MMPPVPLQPQEDKTMERQDYNAWRGRLAGRIVRHAAINGSTLTDDQINDCVSDLVLAAYEAGEQTVTWRQVRAVVWRATRSPVCWGFGDDDLGERMEGRDATYATIPLYGRGEKIDRIVERILVRGCNLWSATEGANKQRRRDVKAARREFTWLLPWVVLERSAAATTPDLPEGSARSRLDCDVVTKRRIPSKPALKWASCGASASLL